MITLPNKKLAAVLENKDSFATSLILVTLDELGFDSVSWDPAVIIDELETGLKVKIPAENVEKLQAGFAAIVSDLAWRDPHVLHATAEALCNEPVLMDMGPLDPDVLAWGVFELGLLHSGPDVSWSEDVCRYAGAVLGWAGLHKKPKVLKFAIMPDDAVEKTASTYSDTDPMIYAAYTQHNEDATQDVDRFVKNRAKALVAEVNKLPLTNRDAKQWNELQARLLKALGVSTPATA